MLFKPKKPDFRYRRKDFGGEMRKFIAISLFLVLAIVYPILGQAIAVAQQKNLNQLKDWRLANNSAQRNQIEKKIFGENWDQNRDSFKLSSDQIFSCRSEYEALLLAEQAPGLDQKKSLENWSYFKGFLHGRLNTRIPGDWFVAVQNGDVPPSKIDGYSILQFKGKNEATISLGHDQFVVPLDTTITPGDLQRIDKREMSFGKLEFTITVIAKRNNGVIRGIPHYDVV